MKRNKIIAWFFGFRKLTIMLVLLALASNFRILNLIDGGQFVDLVKDTSIAFFAANISEHLSKGTLKWWGQEE